MRMSGLYIKYFCIDIKMKLILSVGRCFTGASIEKIYEKS